MAYRDDHGDALEAPTAEGPLEVTLGPNRATLTIGERTLLVADRVATLTEGKKKRSFKIEQRLVIARGFPREDVGLWIAEDARAMRIFGVEPVELLHADGLPALRRLDAVVQRVRAALSDLAGDVARAVEIGSGHDLDKVLLADHGDRYALYARSLFHGAAEPIMLAFADGRIVIADQPKLLVHVHSRFGVTVWGDYIRFADRHGNDLGRVSVPWIGREDREELARRIGQLVDKS
jgi:hypothetical protein